MTTLFNAAAPKRCMKCQLGQGRVCPCRDAERKALGLDGQSAFERWVDSLTPRHGLIWTVALCSVFWACVLVLVAQ